MPAEIHYPSSSLVYCSVEDVFPSEADSFMIVDEGLGPLVKEKWPGKNCEPADPLAHLSFYITEMVTVFFHKVIIADRVEKLKKIHRTDKFYWCKCGYCFI